MLPSYFLAWELRGQAFDLCLLVKAKCEERQAQMLQHTHVLHRDGYQSLGEYFLEYS